MAALANKPVKNPYYFGYTRWIGNYQQQNEAGYPDFSAEPQQVWLALFRYWNVIHYFFPYRDQMDVAWTSRLEELVPVFAQVKDEASYLYALLMISSYLRAFLQRRNEAEVRMTIRRGETISDVTVPSFGYSQLTGQSLSRSIVLPKHQWLDGQVAYLKIYAMSRKEFLQALCAVSNR